MVYVFAVLTGQSTFYLYTLLCINYSSPPKKKCSTISGRYVNWYNLFSVFWQHMSKHLKTVFLKIPYPGVYPKKNFEFIQKDIYVRIYWTQICLLIAQKPIVTTKIITIHKNIRFIPRLACWEDRRRTTVLKKKKSNRKQRATLQNTGAIQSSKREQKEIQQQTSPGD